jgi:pantoate--beta-alanine ligase
MAIQTFTDPAAVRAHVAALKQKGQTLALVPTMGFLHDGHLSLMREGGRRADVVAASIFVNPTQFGPKEDLSRYPRDLEGDLQKCESAGVSFVLAPSAPDAMYPPGYQTYVNVEGVSQGLDGASRPCHFRGVATIVSKLFNVFRPDVALFGEKDYQQLRVIQRLAVDLDHGVEVVGMPIVREPDGLAMSSRNKYLVGEDRVRARALSQGLFAARDAYAAGERDAHRLTGQVLLALAKVDARIDYVQLHDSDTLELLVQADRPARLLVAAFIGTTRLLDNLQLG